MCLATSNNLLLMLYRMPQNAFFPHELAIFWSAENDAKTLFFQSSIPFFPGNFCNLQQCWHLYCFAILCSTSIVIRSVKQRLFRNRRGSDGVTSHDFLSKRLQRAFTRANQIHWTAQKTLSLASALRLDYKTSHLVFNHQITKWEKLIA